MFGLKKLLKRIKSIEDLLGIVYHAEDNEDDWNQHIVTPDSRMRSLDEIRYKERIKNNK